MKVQKIKKYGKHLPLVPFYYDIEYDDYVIFDGRTEKPVKIYTYNKNKAYYIPTSYPYIFARKTVL